MRDTTLTSLTSNNTICIYVIIDLWEKFEPELVDLLFYANLGKFDIIIDDVVNFM
jgi:hypothetical protein